MLSAMTMRERTASSVGVCHLTRAGLAVEGEDDAGGVGVGVDEIAVAAADEEEVVGEGDGGGDGVGGLGAPEFARLFVGFEYVVGSLRRATTALPLKPAPM